MLAVSDFFLVLFVPLIHFIPSKPSLLLHTTYDPCYCPYTTNTTQTSMPPVGLDPTMPASERAANSRLRSRGHWGRPRRIYTSPIVWNKSSLFSCFFAEQKYSFIFQTSSIVRRILIKHLLVYTRNYVTACIFDYLLSANSLSYSIALVIEWFIATQKSRISLHH
jgi:hypothetical protein